MAQPPPGQNADVGGTLRVPPSWGPEDERKYSFRNWQRDTLLWEASTDLQDTQKAPAIALRLRGMAKEVGRNIDTVTLQNGAVDQAGVVQFGVAVLMQALSRKFAPMERNYKSIRSVKSCGFLVCLQNQLMR